MIFEAMIADDEAPARVELRHQLEDTGRMKVVAEAVSFPETVAKLMKGGIDVLFLDWDIADPTSTLLRDALPKMDHVPMLVLMSAYTDYFPEAFGVKPLYYLPKPTDRADLDRCIAAIEKRHLELLERRAR
ncbi:MAG: response regulator [Coriobacteriia bacterium]|nr:response regulator [Coriobacteriia bacterium]